MSSRSLLQQKKRKEIRQTIKHHLAHTKTRSEKQSEKVQNQNIQIHQGEENNGLNWRSLSWVTWSCTWHQGLWMLQKPIELSPAATSDAAWYIHFVEAHISYSITYSSHMHGLCSYAKAALIFMHVLCVHKVSKVQMLSSSRVCTDVWKIYDPAGCMCWPYKLTAGVKTPTQTLSKCKCSMPRLTIIFIIN